MRRLDGLPRRLLSLFPSKARVMAWVKPYAPHRPHVWPTYAWEPLVVGGALPGRPEQKAAARTPHDWLNVSPKVPRKGGHESPRPEAFAEWVLIVTLGPRMGRVCELFAGTAPIARLAAERRVARSKLDLRHAPAAVTLDSAGAASRVPALPPSWEGRGKP